MVRTFAPYDRTKQRSKTNDKKKYKERTSNEWDVRIDCDPTYAEEIAASITKAQDMINYCLISGIEKADSEQLKAGSTNNHVHIALIFKYDLRRDQVLAICRGLIKRTDEYCTPRNKKFTYAGWYLHHTKIDWKMVLEPAVRLELGLLPEDDHTEYNITSIRRLFKKFGCDDETRQSLNHIKFAKYLID